MRGVALGLKKHGDNTMATTFSFSEIDGMVKRTTVVDYGTEMKKTTSDHTIQVCVSM